LENVILQDFDWKSLTLEQLNWAFRGVEFKRPPRKHQMISLAFAMDKSRVAFWHGVGTGKTLAAYYTAQLWGCKKILVVAPKSALSSWIRDNKWTDYTYLLINGTTEERKQQINGPQDVSIVQYESLKTIYADYGKKGKSKNGWHINPDLFCQKFDCIIFDEMHRCSNYDSLQSKIAVQLSRKASHVIGLTGTPVDKVLLECFNIYYVLDLGKTLGNSFWKFRLDHFDKNFFDWSIKKGHKEKLLKKMAPVTLSFSSEECMDLPPCQNEEIFLDPTLEFFKLENRVITNKPIQVASSDAIFPQPSVKGTKLKQLTGGFIYLGDETNRNVYRLKENPKLEATLDILQNTRQKTILFYEFLEVGSILEQALKKEKISYSVMRGGMQLEDRLEQERKFQEDPDTQVILVQIAGGSEGWDGYAAKVIIFWDIVASPKLRTQCVGRMVRQGQTDPTVVYELILQGTINETTKANQADRWTEIEGIMDYLRKYELRNL